MKTHMKKNSQVCLPQTLPALPCSETQTGDFPKAVKTRSEYISAKKKKDRKSSANIHDKHKVSLHGLKGMSH